MPRELGSITKKDMVWYALMKRVRRVITTKKEWSEFKRYMSVYFK